jgi:hypothetical protein
MIGLRSLLAAAAATAVAVLTGCASAPLAPDVAASLAPLRDARIAVSYDLIHKELTSNETLYRVVYLTFNSSKQDFSGVWSADEDMSGYFVDSLHAQSLHAESVYSLAPPSVIASANEVHSKKVVDNLVDKNPEVFEAPVKGVKVLPLRSFFETWPADPEFAALSDALQAKGVRYLLQLTTLNVQGLAPGYGMVVVRAFPNARVLDLAQHKVLWTGYRLQSDLFQLGGDLKALEINGMAKTKEGMANGAKHIDFASAWQLK